MVGIAGKGKGKSKKVRLEADKLRGRKIKGQY